MRQAKAQDRLVIVAILTPHGGWIERFREYETRAAAVIARHHGVIERTVITEPSEPGQSVREVHIVTFPDREACRKLTARRLTLLEGADKIEHTLSISGSSSRVPAARSRLRGSTGKAGLKAMMAGARILEGYNT